MNAIKSLIPDKLKHAYWKRLSDRELRERFQVDSTKYARELDFWQSRYDEESGQLANGHFRTYMLAMANESDDSFCRDKIVADFGSGPRGSLEWIQSARQRICIDVLADEYRRFGIAKQCATYVCSSEDWIPLPSAYVDVLFTMNALDHVDNLERQCNELIRILAPGGQFIGSFNLDEPASDCEPQTLNEGILRRLLLDHLEVVSYRLVPAAPDGNRYAYFFEEHPAKPEPGSPSVLWVRAMKSR